MKHLAFVFLLFAFTAKASTYYFSTTDGDDSRSTRQAQNSATPWKTLSKFNATIFSAGDVILFKRGDIFYGSITISQSGTNGNSIKLGAYGKGEKPLFSGFATVHSWTRLGNNIWESNVINDAPASFRPSIVLVGGKVQPLGRYPNYDSETKGYLYYESYNENASIIDNDLPTTTNWAGAEIVIRKNRYVLDVGAITSQNSNGSGGSVITYSGTSSEHPSAGFGYFIQNDIRTLDQDGEWYFDPSSKKLKIYSAKQPATTQIGIPTNLIYAKGQSYITIDGLAFEGSKGSAVQFESKAICDTVRNCDLSNIGGFGINISKLTNSAIVSCKLTNILDGGINSSVEGANNYIGYNTLTNIAFVPGASGNGAGSSALNNGGTGTVTEYNSIDNTGYNGIKYGGTNSAIRYNRITNFCTIKDDGGGLYRKSLIANESNIRIYNNIISNGIGAPKGTNSPNSNAEGIYPDDKENGTLIYDNTIFNISQAGIYLHNTNNIAVSGNLIYNCQMGFRTRGAANFTFTKNTIIATNSSDYLIHCNNNNSDITRMGIIDSNYLIQPSSGLIHIETPKGKNYTVAEWKAAYPMYDANTSFNQVPANNLKDIRFEYNANISPVVITLDANYRNVTGADYNNDRITLPPYTSIVLMKADRARNSSSNANNKKH